MRSVHVSKVLGKWVIENCLGTFIPHRHFLTTFVDSSVTGLPGCTDKKIKESRKRASIWQKKNYGKYRKRLRRWNKLHIEYRKKFQKWYQATHRDIIRSNNKKWKKLHPRYVRMRGNYDGIRGRCNNPNIPSYKWYGGRGIKCFLTWDQYLYLMSSKKVHNMKCPSIDRIDNNGNYSVDNCRVIERSDNSKNRYHDLNGIHPTFWEKVHCGSIKINKL